MTLKTHLKKDENIFDHYAKLTPRELSYYLDYDSIKNLYLTYWKWDRNKSLNSMINQLQCLGFLWVEVLCASEYTANLYKCKFINLPGDPLFLNKHDSSKQIFNKELTLSIKQFFRFMHKDEWLRLLFLRELKINGFL